MGDGDMLHAFVPAMCKPNPLEHVNLSPPPPPPPPPALLAHITHLIFHIDRMCANNGVLEHDWTGHYGYPHTHTHMCSGLYPQVAIADDCNSYRRDSEQVFHTKVSDICLCHEIIIYMVPVI